ncbi:MAG: sulfotransferase [Pseudomonadota bacterium]
MPQPGIRGFILGSRRSGSNLLRVMLNQSPHLAAPHPPHLLHAFTDLLPHYGELADEARWRALVQDVVAYANLNPVPLLADGHPLEAEAVAARCRERSLIWLHDAVYTEIMARNGKSAWVCKSNDNIHYLEAIEAAFADSARYIYLCRDGRDVALSFRKAPIGPKHPYLCATDWTRTQQRMLDWERRTGPRTLRVHYEDLTGRPEATCRQLCGFLGVPFHPAMLDAHRSDEASRTAGQSVLWANLTRPVQAGNSEKWRHDSLHNVQQFERAAGPALAALGYPLACAPLAPPCEAETASIHAEDRRLRDQVRADLGRDGGTRDAQAAFLVSRRQALARG